MCFLNFLKLITFHFSYYDDHSKYSIHNYRLNAQNNAIKHDLVDATHGIRINV